MAKVENTVTSHERSTTIESVTEAHDLKTPKCGGFRKEQPERVGIFGKERESITLGKSIVTNRDGVAVGRVIVDLLPVSPSGRSCIEIILSIDEHCTTITGICPYPYLYVAEGFERRALLVGERERAKCQIFYSRDGLPEPEQCVFRTRSLGKRRYVLTKTTVRLSSVM